MRAPGLLVTGALVLAAGMGLRGQQPSFRASVDSVDVTVSVDDRGHVVNDLAANDFEVRDNNIVQKLTSVGREGLPIDIAFVVDVSGSVRGPLLTALTRAVNTVGAQLGTNDRASVTTFNHRIFDVRPLSTGWPASFAFSEAAGQTSLFDALTAALITTPDAGRHRMTIVFTDGRDTTSFLDGATLMDVARRADTSVFVVALTLGPKGSASKPAHEALFQALAESTGGALTTLRANEDLGGSFDSAFNRFRTSYVLRYTYAGPPREGWHALSVKVTRRGNFEVHSRQGYFTSGGQ